MSVVLRDEREGDARAIAALLDEAFEGTEESGIVERLRASGAELVSIVAVEGDRIFGHILFSPATIGSVRGMGLAPMAVAPERQRQGIGSRLVEAGLERLRLRGCPFVIVLGHPEYYPRFGFEPASRRGVHCVWDVPDEVFRIMVLDEPAFGDAKGLARYRPEFGGAP